MLSTMTHDKVEDRTSGYVNPLSGTAALPHRHNMMTHMQSATDLVVDDAGQIQGERNSAMIE